MARGLKAEVVAAVKPLLLELGFRKRTGGVFTIELAEDVFGVVGSNSAYHQATREVEVYPILGVRHHEVQRLVAEFEGEEFKRSDTFATISEPLNSLFRPREYIAWFFHADRLESTAREMVDAIVEHGLPWLRANVSLEALRERIGEGCGHRLEYHLPAVLSLLGEHDAALDAVRAELAGMADRDDPAAEDFRRFADAFMRRHPLQAT